MGLKKKKSTKYGIDGEYWKIVRFNHNIITNKTSFDIALYKNETTSSSASPLEVISIQFPYEYEDENGDTITVANPLTPDALDMVNANPFTVAYTWFKQNYDLFSDAIDC